MIAAIIIDLDDTLCMTEQVSYEMENETLRRLGRPPMPRAIHLQTWGKPLFEIITTRSPGVDAREFEMLFPSVMSSYIASGKIDTMTPENLRALEQLINENKRLYILTSRTHAELKHLLEPDHALAKHITAFYYRDNMQFHKPDPRAFNLLLQEHHLAPNECVYVGDSVSDAEAAKKAHLHFIANLESGLKVPADFADHAVDLFINRFADVVEGVRTLEQRPGATV